MDFLGFNRQLEVSLQMLEQESVDDDLERAGLPPAEIDGCANETGTQSTEFVVLQTPSETNPKERQKSRKRKPTGTATQAKRSLPTTKSRKKRPASFSTDERRDAAVKREFQYLNTDSADTVAPANREAKPVAESNVKRTRLTQNAEAQRRYRMRLKVEKNALKDVADALAKRVKALEDANVEMRTRLAMLESPASGAVSTNSLAGHSAVPFKEAVARSAWESSSSALYATTGVLIEKTIPLIFMQHKIAVARLRQLLELVPSEGDADQALLSRLSTETRVFLQEKATQRRQLEQMGLDPKDLVVDAHDTHIAPELAAQVKGILSQIKYNDNIGALVRSTLQGERAKMRSLYLDRQMLNAEISTLMRTANAAVHDISASVGGAWIQRARAAKAIVSATTRLNNNLSEQQEVAPRLLQTFVCDICPPVQGARLLLAALVAIDTLFGGPEWPKIENKCPADGVLSPRIQQFLCGFRELIVRTLVEMAGESVS